MEYGIFSLFSSQYFNQVEAVQSHRYLKLAASTWLKVLVKLKV